MFKIEDATPPPQSRTRVMVIRGTETDFDRLCEILRTVEPTMSHIGDRDRFHNFRHALESACAW